MYEIGDKVKVLKTGYHGEILGKKDVLGKVTYLVQQSNGQDINAVESDLKKVK